jgi:hypothetical protein
LEEENLCDILNDSSRVFNGDETGFFLCPKTKTILAPKDVYKTAVGRDVVERMRKYAAYTHFPNFKKRAY